MDKLNQITDEYLKQNGISIRHFSECIGAGYVMTTKWLEGTRRLNAEQIKKVHKFLNGEYIKSVRKIMEEYGNGEK